MAATTAKPAKGKKAVVLLHAAYVGHGAGAKLHEPTGKPVEFDVAVSDELLAAGAARLAVDETAPAATAPADDGTEGGAAD